MKTLLRVVCVAGICLMLPHYPENPPFIIGASALLLGLLLFLTHEKLVLYPDRITKTQVSLFGLLRRPKGISFPLSDIHMAYLDKPSKPDIAGMIVKAAVILISPEEVLSRSTAYPIYLSMNNGPTVLLETILDREERQGFVNQINAVIADRTLSAVE